VPYFVYPYLTASPTSSASATSTSTSTASPFPYSPAGGAPGGNPSLYDTLYSVSAVVTNTGNRAGKEVVQLYLSFPESVGEPPGQLRGFEKISLQPGENTTVNFDLLRKDLSYWDVVSQNWVVPNGIYTIYVGRSSRNFLLQQTLDVS
jgi:beta-glucosidase